MFLNANSFSEFGVSFGQTLFHRGSHFVKAGLSYKRLVGIYAAYMELAGAEYSLENMAQPDSLYMQLSAREYRLGFSNQNPLEFSLGGLFSSAGGAGMGHAFDIGLTYEFRPKVEQHEYFMDGKIRLDNTRNKYKFRAGFALLDIGKIDYQKPDVRAIKGSLEDLKLSRENFQQVGNSPAATLEELFRSSDEDMETVSFLTQLPRRMNLQLDYHVANNFYLNMMLEKSLPSEGISSMKIPSVLALTPRFESDWGEFAMPVSMVEGYKEVAVGTAFKLAFIELGVSNMLGLFSSKKVVPSNIYLGLRLFNVRGKRKDSDNDGVSDRYDICKDVQGVWEFRGCPDTDFDGVEDQSDECPEIAGPVGLNGCPDTDEDGIRDKSDLCPYEKGSGNFYGCNDSDGDGVPDYEDDCPSLAGLAGYFGCPDTDGDGIADSEDLCPRVTGLAEFGGCPDTDGDGISDADDECPTVAGSYRLNGCIDSDGDEVPDHKDECPEEKGSSLSGGCIDTDMDGVADKLDECLEIPGERLNRGCPVFHSGYEEVSLTESEQQALKAAEQLMEFDSRRQLTAHSKENLMEVVDILQKNPDYKLLIMYFGSFGGKTDPAEDSWDTSASGSDNDQNVSEAHARAVQQLMLDQNLFSDQVRTEQRWIEDISEEVEWNQLSMLMLRIIR